MKFNFLKIALLSLLMSSFMVVLSSNPANACLTPWTDDWDWIDDNVLPETGDMSETILPISDIYVTNENDHIIYVTVSYYLGYVCGEIHGCNGGYWQNIGTWEIRGNEHNVFIINNASTVNDENGAAMYAFEAISADGTLVWNRQAADLNGSSRFTFTFQ